MPAATGTGKDRQRRSCSSARRRPAWGRHYDERAGSRVIPEEVRHKASRVIVASFLVVFAVSWLLFLTQETTFSEALFETVSAFGTVGFSLGLTGKLEFLGQVLMMLIMFWGRLGALTIVVALAQPRVADRVGYPEESILP